MRSARHDAPHLEKVILLQMTQGTAGGGVQEGDDPMIRICQFHGRSPAAWGYQHIIQRQQVPLNFHKIMHMISRHDGADIGGRRSQLWTRTHHTHDAIIEMHSRLHTPRDSHHLQHVAHGAFRHDDGRGEATTFVLINRMKHVKGKSAAILTPCIEDIPSGGSDQGSREFDSFSAGALFEQCPDGGRWCIQRIGHARLHHRQLRRRWGHEGEETAARKIRPVNARHTDSAADPVVRE